MFAKGKDVENKQQLYKQTKQRKKNTQEQHIATENLIYITYLISYFATDNIFICVCSNAIALFI